MAFQELQCHEFEIAFQPKKLIKCIKIPTEEDSSDSPFIFTHGAGGTLNSAAVLNFRSGFARIRPIICFQGNMNLNSRVKMFDAVISEKPTSALGGRSMGARAAVIAAKERDDIKHLVLVSYPLHTGKELRDQILLDIPEGVKVLFIIGDGDAMCELSRLEDVRKKLHAKSWLLVVRGADHGMDIKPARGTKGMGELVGEISAKWLQKNNEKTTEGAITWKADGEGSAVWNGWETSNGTCPEGAKKGNRRKRKQDQDQDLEKCIKETKPKQKKI